MSAPSHSKRVANGQQGFTLIEALIAFVVLTVGVLGIISLLLMSKNALHQSNQRSIAVNLADAMVERIRINPTVVADYDTAGTPLGDGDLTAPAQDCEATSCSAAQLAAYDLWVWDQELAGSNIVVDGENVGGLIAPQGCITFTAENGLTSSGLLNVTIQWRGLAETVDAVPADGVACGGADAGEDPYRRQVTVNTVVVDEAEF
ncbi:MAG: type IV pilus modification protein PilV [Halioglobus sp.]